VLIVPLLTLGFGLPLRRRVSASSARPGAPQPTRTLAAEQTIGRLLMVFTYISAGLLAVGAVLTTTAGISPLSDGPDLDSGTLATRTAALDPGGFLWLGPLAAIAAPIGPVIVAAIAYLGDADWLMVAVSIAILAVIAIGIASTTVLS
jgi:uncharacterized membrane protein